MVRRALVSLALLLSVACSGGSGGFQGQAGKKSGEAPKSERPAGSDGGGDAARLGQTTTGQPGDPTLPPPVLGEDDENQLADKPQQVSGAFLTCVTVYYPKVSKDSFYGCTVRDKDGRKADMRGHQIDWQAVDEAKAPAPLVTIEAMGPNSFYHAQARKPEGLAGRFSLQAKVTWANGLEETLEDRLGGRKGEFGYRLGGFDDFHFGDGAFQGSTCKTKLGQLPVNGTRMRSFFRVPDQGTSLTVVLSDVCGVDRAEGNLIEIVGAQDGKEYLRANMPADQAQVTLKTVDLPKGDYYLWLKLVPRAGDGDHDNFSIGDIFYKTTEIIGVAEIKPLE